MKKIFLKFTNAKPWIAVVTGIIFAVAVSFLISAIVNLIFYYNI